MEKIAHKIEEKERTDDIKLKLKVPFAKMLLSNNVRKGLNEAGFVYPTNIQANAIPVGKAGIDLLIQAKSGTGKTLIFSTILLEAFNNDIREPQSLILVPTREIAVQIEVIVDQIGKFCPGFKVVSVIGGLSIADDRKNIQSAKTIVGTPGRVLHLIRNDVLNTSRIRLLVLDEADKLLSETFRQDIDTIIKSLPSKRQIIACSATFCNDLDKEFVKYMRNPLLISTEKRATLLIGIKQFVYELPEFKDSGLEMDAKIEALNKILSKISFKQCLVFSGSHIRVDTYKNLLSKHDWPCEVITGAQNQKTRLEIFKIFREFKTRILFSTDLMSRGIDSENVNLVVNLEVPDSGATYLHRIGRAGRFGSHGVAITFLCSKEDKLKFSKILNEIGDDMVVMKFPPDDIPDLWNFSNLNQEQNEFGVFERIFSETKDEYQQNDTEINESTKDVQINHENDSHLLPLPTDSFSSSSQRQNSINATTLDDASSLAVDSDIHLEGSNAATNNSVPEKKASSKMKRSKSKDRKKKAENKNIKAVEILFNEDCNQPNEKMNKQKCEQKVQDCEKKDEHTEKHEKFNNVKDESNETQSDIGNSSGGDTRTIIDFKSLVVDKGKAELKKTPSNDIFADYEIFKNKPSGSGSKSESLKVDKEESTHKEHVNDIFCDYETFKEKSSEDEKKSKSLVIDDEKLVKKKYLNDVFDDYEIFQEKPQEKESTVESHSKEVTAIFENYVEHTTDSSLIPVSNSNQCELNPQNSEFENEDKSILSPNIPGPPNPSPKELRLESRCNFDNQAAFNKLQIQNLPSHEIPSQINNPETDTSTDDDEDEGESYTSTSTSSRAVTRSSGFDERTTSLGSSGIVTSTDADEYVESEESYYLTSDDEIDGDDEYFEISEGSEEDSSETSDSCIQYYEDGFDNIEKKKKEKNSTSNKSSQTEAGRSTENAQINLNDPSYRYQQAYTLWTNMYWNQLTQIKDYTNFSSYVRKQGNKF